MSSFASVSRKALLPSAQHAFCRWQSVCLNVSAIPDPKAPSAASSLAFASSGSPRLLTTVPRFTGLATSWSFLGTPPVANFDHIYLQQHVRSYGIHSQSHGATPLSLQDHHAATSTTDKLSSAGQSAEDRTFPGPHDAPSLPADSHSTTLSSSCGSSLSNGEVLCQQIGSPGAPLPLVAAVASESAATLQPGSAQGLAEEQVGSHRFIS